jgi:acyl carrier protein
MDREKMENQKINLLNVKIQELLAEAFQVSPEILTPDLEFGDIPEWDSLGHMELMMQLEDEFGIEISADTIAELISIPRITEYIENQGK